MHRIMLDHFRRWSRVLVVIGIAEFALGGLIAIGPELPFEFWALLLTMWAGATLMSFDFKRGLLRPIGVLPLTGRELGRSWWLATVALPALTLTALLFSGAATYCLFWEGRAFPITRLLLGSLFNFVWLGTQFTMTFLATRGMGGSRLELISNGLVGLITSLVYFSNMLLCLNAAASILKSSLLLVLGAPLTFVGWFFAEQFETGRAAFYLGRIEAPIMGRRNSWPSPTKSVASAGQFKVPDGYGAMRFLLSTVPVRAFFHMAFMVALMALVFRWLSAPADPELWTPMVSFMPAWFIVFYQFMPVLQHLRVLRTMPITAGGLAIVLLALVLVPLAALCMLVSLLVWPFWGASAALGVSNCFAFAIGGATLCAFVAVWRGSNVQGYSLILLSLFGFLLGHLWLQGHFRYLERPWALAGGPIALACVLVAFVLTRLALVHSSQIYRNKLEPFGEFPMPRNQ